MVSEDCPYAVPPSVVVHEHRGEPDGLVVCHLPYGPTAYFGIHHVVTRHDIGTKSEVGTMSEVICGSDCPVQVHAQPSWRRRGTLWHMCSLKGRWLLPRIAGLPSPHLRGFLDQAGGACPGHPEAPLPGAEGRQQAHHEFH